ncbi:uncharacterized protein [Dermacentor andersoni]|uniref:uncharacterized protein isoform X2 n=1 Tax=Dermacentor andersoni TaxID=34620 RepID=UPI00241687C9|nr:uncharacterized protein LOC126547780 isoform X2 [Dermacentor andersoni]
MVVACSGAVALWWHLVRRWCSGVVGWFFHVVSWTPLEPTSHSSDAPASEMQPVRSSDHGKESSSDQGSLVGQRALSAEDTGCCRTESSCNDITAEKMKRSPCAENNNAEVLSEDVLAQVAEIEAHAATKPVKTAVSKRRPKRTAAAVWTNGDLCLRAVELSCPAPVAEKAKQFRHESLYGGRIHRMSVGAFLGLQKKKTVRRRAMKVVVQRD